MKIFGYFDDPAVLNMEKIYQCPLNRGVVDPRTGGDLS
jgi:hypothetical protein